MELIIAFGITWLIMRSVRLVRDEWRHSRDTHMLTLGRQHSDWSPGRVRRNARRRARGDWWTEIRDGFPTLKRTLAEDRELARAVRAEAEAEGAVRIRDLRRRAKAAVARRDAVRREDAATPGADPAGAEPAAEPGARSPEPAPVPVPEPAPASAAEPSPEPAPGTGSEEKPVPVPPVSRAEETVPAADDDAVPNPPGDETTDETTEREGDGVPNIEEAETPYQGMQDAFSEYAQKAAAIAKEASDDLAAQAAIHGFDRDSATMADIQALADQADALVARANAARTGLIGRHNAGEEYHGTGSDADASAFRAA